MDHSQLWQSILEQLQQELPRVSYDTWLRDTQAVSFADGVLCVTAQNMYARDWLEKRLEATASGLLSKLVQADARVSFSVEQEDGEDQLELEDEAESRFIAEIVDDTEYQNEVRPERVVLFEGYALRYLEHGEATPKEMSIWMAMEIPVYRLYKKGEDTVKNIPYWEVLRFANMSKASFFRETTGRDSIAGGLVEIVPTPGIPVNDRRIDHARRYRIHMIPRLTRRDCAVLQEILRREVCMAASREEALSIAHQTLQGLLKGEPGKFLEQFQKIEVPENQVRSLAEIVRKALDISGKLPDDLRKLAEKVTDRIVRGFGKVLVTHYFLQTVTRKYKLTHPQIWAIIALRDRCWYDHETRSQKEFALVRGGLTEVGSWVGVDRKTVRRWLQDPSFAAFVQVSDAVSMNLDSEWVDQRTVFRVRQDEPVDGLAGWDKVSTDAGQSEYRPGTKCDTGWDKVSTGMGQSEYLLNILTQPHENPKEPQKSPPASAGVGKRGFWDLDFLLENNRVQPGSRKRLFTANKSWGRDLAALSAGFVSWVLYAYSPEGVKLRDPIGLAIQRLSKNVHAGAGGGFDRLAHLRPYELRALFDADMAGVALDDSPEADLYRVNFARLLPEHKLELYWRLFGYPVLVNAEEGDVAVAGP